MKFKEGDMVRIKTWEEMEKEYPVEEFGIRVYGEYFSKFMKPLCGKVAIVEETEEEGYRLRPMAVEDLKLDWDWAFTDDMLKEG